MRNFINIVEGMEWPSTITPDQLVHWISDNHHSPEDLGEGDLSERVWAFKKYALQTISMDQLNLEEWNIDEQLVGEYRDEIERGSTPPPIIYDPVNQSIIDGTHRANAIHAMGNTHILAYVGDASTYEQPQYNDYDDD